MTASDSSGTDLPGVLAEIEAVAGRDAALLLALAHGGEDIYIAARGARARKLAATVGGAAAWEAIVARLGGEIVHVPLARRVLVRHLSDEGLDTAQIARRLRITRSTVRRYRREGAE